LFAKAFWHHAEKLEPSRPWLAVTREFDVGELVAWNCYHLGFSYPRRSDVE